MKPERQDGLFLSRRRLFTAGAGLAAAGGISGLLAACGGDDDEEGSGQRARATEPRSEGTPVVGDVLDFSLRSEEWEGAFGFVTLRLHRGLVDGDDVWFIRTDVSDEQFATREKLVFTPKLEPLADADLSGELFLVEAGPAVLSSRPGRDDYTPAWRVRRASWRQEPRTLSSVKELRSAARRGELTVEDTGAVMNAAIVKWPGGEIGVDRKLRAYLEGGQLIEEPDTRAGEVKFKLHECFPNARYIVTDHSIKPAAEMTQTAFAPRLHAGPRDAGGTGRTNVFMDGLKGSGPMGAQPSVFDSDPGDPVWSPYWDHFTYSWAKKEKVRVLRSERQVHAARDVGELKEFPGTPDTKGEVFTVNCQVPVTAPATFRA
jgi:hypothetical protein